MTSADTIPANGNGSAKRALDTATQDALSAKVAALECLLNKIVERLPTVAEAMVGDARMPHAAAPAAATPAAATVPLVPNGAAPVTDVAVPTPVMSVPGMFNKTELLASGVPPEIIARLENGQMAAAAASGASAGTDSSSIGSARLPPMAPLPSAAVLDGPAGGTRFRLLGHGGPAVRNALLAFCLLPSPMTAHAHMLRCLRSWCPCWQATPSST